MDSIFNAINECYLEILNRPADRSGIMTYMRQITRGWSKEDIGETYEK